MFKYCKDININILDKKIKLYGWIQNKRCLKNIIFVIFRDSTGIIQIVFNKINFKKKKFFDVLNNFNIESCIEVKGYVKKKNDINSNNIFEILAYDFFIIEKSEKLPINIEDKNISEEIKLKFRYLYLRRSNVKDNIKIKSDIIWYINKFMKKNKFIYIETPILSKPTTEGSRNYLIESRIYKNKFYSLSESPQIFKQLLMISGFNKYYQIVKCFRDEDLRKNRQPEFTQLDIESSFIDENYIMKLSEKLIKYLFKKIKNINIDKIKRISYKESIEKFGTDKPDLRNPIKILNLKNLLIENNFFIKEENYIYIIYLNNKIEKNYILNNKLFYNKLINVLFINYIDIKNIMSNLQYSFICKNNIDSIINLIFKKIDIKKYKYIILLESKKDILIEIGNFINYLSNKLNLINKNNLSLIWIKDFPMFKKNKLNKLESVHHPFTAPKYFKKFIKMVKNPELIISNSYDLIINGDEIASGSVRINNFNLQKSVFDILKISNFIQEKTFGFFLNALKYGTPNHAGIGLGIDRLTMILTNTNNIKNVIAFPKSNSFYDIMTNSPIEI